MFSVEKRQKRLIQSSLVLLSVFGLLMSSQPVEASRLRKSGTGTVRNEINKENVHVNTESHEQARLRNSIEVCSHIADDPSTPYKLRMMTLNGNGPLLCCACPSGTRLKDLCRPNEFNTTSCVPCNATTYVDEIAHTLIHCKNETLECNDNENYLYVPSNITVGPKCHCNPNKGLFLSSNGTCLPHSSCPPGQGVRFFGDSFHDTTCETCRDGYESPNLSPTEKCFPGKSLQNHPRNQHLFSSNSSNANNSTLYDDTTSLTTAPSIVSTQIPNVTGAIDKTKCESPQNSCVSAKIVIILVVLVFVGLLIAFRHHVFHCCRQSLAMIQNQPGSGNDEHRVMLQNNEDHDNMDQRSHLDLLSSMIFSKRGCAEPLINQKNGKHLQKCLIGLVINNLIANCGNCGWAITLDDVCRYCHEHQIPVPSNEERSLDPVTCMAKAIERAYELEKTTYADILSFFRKLGFNVVFDSIAL